MSRDPQGANLLARLTTPRPWREDRAVKVLAFIGFALLLFWWFYAGMRFVISYRIREGAVDVRLMKLLTIVRLRPRDVVKVEKVRALSLRAVVSSQLAASLGNRLWGDCLIVTKRRGIVRRILITPDDVDAYGRALRAGDAAPGLHPVG